MTVLADADFEPLFEPGLSGWWMAGRGGVAPVGDALETRGGPGILWYAPRVFDDVALRVDWRLTGPEDNSGLFLRIPPLDASPEPAIREGYEVQIDDRGFDPGRRRLGSPLHRTGAIYGLAPARRRASRPVGAWNEFEIVATGSAIAVWLNGALTASLSPAARRASGHIGLQTHHPGSAVQFRNLRACALAGRALALHDPAYMEG